MITKIEGTANGYQLHKDSTNDEFLEIVKSAGKIECFLMHETTYVYFIPGLLEGCMHISINNHVPPNQFFINSVR